MKIFLTTKYGYRYNRLLTGGTFLFICFFAVYIMYVNNFSFTPMPYFKCEQKLCENPFFQMTDCKMQITIIGLIPLYTTEDCKKTCVWCNQQFLSEGVYGYKPKLSFFIDYGHSIVFLLLIWVFIINHVLYNRGKIPEFDFIITKRLTYNSTDIIKNFGKMK